MKYIKVLIIAIVAMFSFATAQAQVTLRAHIGPRHGRYYWHHRYYHHRAWRAHHWRYY